MVKIHFWLKECYLGKFLILNFPSVIWFNVKIKLVQNFLTFKVMLFSVKVKFYHNEKIKLVSEQLYSQNYEYDFEQ